MKKAVVIFSGGIDSICTCLYLKSKYELYGIYFSYGQREKREIRTNFLTTSQDKIPQKFDYSIVVPIRNAIFLSIATAWAFTLNASLVAYGAHKGDKNYPDCRPSFSKKIEYAFNEGEIDGIKLGIRKKISIWSPYRKGLSKSDLLKKG